MNALGPASPWLSLNRYDRRMWGKGTVQSNRSKWRKLEQKANTTRSLCDHHTCVLRW